MVSSYHVHGTFGIKTRHNLVKRIVRDLRKYEFDAIAVRGVSGLSIGPIIAYLMGKHLMVVRKPFETELCHADQLVECEVSTGSYIILDDFVAQGHTAHAIRDAIMVKYPGFVLVGGYVYKPDNKFDVPGMRNLNS